MEKLHTMSHSLGRDENFALGELGEEFKHGDAGKEGEKDEDDQFDAMYVEKRLLYWYILKYI